MSVSLARGFFSYTSDDGTAYQIGTTLENGTTVNGASTISPGALPTYPRGWVMRHIYGSASGHPRTKVPIFDPTDALWVGGSHSFTKDSVSYTIEGRVGEKRFNRGG